jgi:hypothetical protein
VSEPIFDQSIGEWVSVAEDGTEVFGQSPEECQQRLRERNRHLASAASKNPEDYALWVSNRGGAGA